MSIYRRLYIRGGCYFFTLVTQGRKPIFGIEESIDRLRSAFRHIMAKHPFEIDAMVVLPDHLHCIWRLPPQDDNYSLRWRLIKHHVSCGSGLPCNRRREKMLWQRRFWEHAIRDERDWHNHMDYIHYNPVKHGFVTRPMDWKASSFRYAVSRGWYDHNWGSQQPHNIANMRLE